MFSSSGSVRWLNPGSNRIQIAQKFMTSDDDPPQPVQPRKTTHSAYDHVTELHLTPEEIKAFATNQTADNNSEGTGFNFLSRFLLGGDQDPVLDAANNNIHNVASKYSGKRKDTGLFVFVFLCCIVGLFIWAFKKRARNLIAMRKKELQLAAGQSDPPQARASATASRNTYHKRNTEEWIV